MNFKNIIELLGWSKNKFYDNIDRICSKEAYGINRSKFTKAGVIKEDYEKEDKNFCFKEQWKDMALVLFTMFVKNPFYRENSTANSITLGKIIEYNTDCLRLVEEKLPDYQRREIQLHPVYAATLIETKAMKKISEKVQFLLTSLSEMPIEARTEVWVNFDKLINHQLIQSYLSSLDTKKKIEEGKGKLFKKQLYGEYEHISLDKYLAQVLEKEMDAEFVKDRDAISELYVQSQKELDKRYMDICEDTPEEIEAINRMYEGSGLDGLIQRTQDKMIENLIEERLTEAAKMIEDSTSIDSTIDEIISDLEKAGGINNKNQIEKLKGVKAITSKNAKDIQKFSSIADKILCELNYNIINRK